jgi:predicted acylesterase/phospholipase RssA
MKIPSNLYLGGGAFGCIYHIGVIKALYEANINDLVIYGNSAGALIAVFYILKVPADEISRIFSDVVERATIQIITKPAEIMSYQLTQHHLYAFDIIHKQSPDAYKKCSGKLKIGVTLDKTGFQWKDTFTS